MTDLIVTEQKDGVLLIRMNRPDKKNALNVEMYDAMSAALAQADEDEATRAVILTGTGDAYTSGNDLADFLNVPRDPDGSGAGFRFLQAISSFEKPLIAAVNGIAVGIGSTMLLHCDLVYAAEEARFHFPFVDLALVPEAASSLILPKMMGHQRAAELILLAEPFDAAKAQEVGIVNAVVPRKKLMDTAFEKAGILAAKAPGALRASKRLLKRGDEAVSARLSAELTSFVERLKSPEAREVMQAFLEKRKPDFSNVA